MTTILQQPAKRLKVNASAVIAGSIDAGGQTGGESLALATGSGTRQPALSASVEPLTLLGLLQVVITAQRHAEEKNVDG